MASTLSKTINPQLVEVTFTNSMPFIEKYSDYLNLVSDFKNELQAFLAYDAACYKGDFVTGLKSFYGDLNSKYVNFDSEFLIYYIKKYNAMADELKKAIAPSISNQSFLSNISDSVGILTNTETMLTDCVIPIADVNVSTYPAPFVYPSNLKNKIRPVAKEIASNLSRQTTVLFRNNIVNVQFTYALASEAHGSNLVTDFNAYLNARKNSLEVTKKLSTDFGNVFKLVTYYGTLNDFSGYNPGDPAMNLQRIANASYKLNVEGALIELDLLGKQIEAARRVATIKQSLMVISDSQTKAIQKPIGVVQNVNSTKPMPLNSTAPAGVAVVNNVLQPNTTISQAVPANSSAPNPVGYTASEKQKQASVITDASKAKLAKKDVDVASSTNFSTSKVSTLMPEFPRIPFAFAVTSPFGIFNVAKSIICKLKSLNLNKLTNMKFPKLSDVFKKPNYAKIKKAINALILKAQIYIIKKILSLIPKIPDIKALIAQFKKMIKDLLKQIFTCNPDNKA